MPITRVAIYAKDIAAKVSNTTNLMKFNSIKLLHVRLQTFSAFESAGFPPSKITEEKEFSQLVHGCLLNLTLL